MAPLVVRGARPYGGEPIDLVVADGVVVDRCAPGQGTGQMIEAEGLILLPGWSTCIPTCVSRARRMPRRC